MNSMVEVLAGHAAAQPQALFCADPQASYTYAQGWSWARRIASALLERGLKAGDYLVVECTQDTRFLLLDMGAELAGVVFVPFERRAAQARVDDICAEVEPALVVLDSEYNTSAPAVGFDELLAQAQGAPEAELPFPAADDLAEILYTTGTTGKSKGIECTHRNNIALAENIMYAVQMRPGSVELLPLPINHSHGIRCCYANLLNGGAVVIVDGVMRVAEIFQLLQDYTVRAMDLSPTAAQVLMRLTRGKLADFNEQLDYIQIGSSALPEETKELLQESFPDVRLYNFYGSTESGRTCALDFNAERGRKNCIGKPTKNSTFIIVDQDRKPIESSADNTGLVATAGPMNMRGYFKQPELTAAAMENGFVYTKDLGYIDEDGYVYVLGRADDIINFKGIKIAPEEIEETARSYRKVVDCACVPLADKDAGQVPKLFISVKNPERFDRKEFYAFLVESLDKNKVPKEIEIIDEIPRSANGKLQRAKLR
ncbi:MAG: class I adenylate-forming enzyme family protein [Coriobacteriales bacterium]